LIIGDRTVALDRGRDFHRRSLRLVFKKGIVFMGRKLAFNREKALEKAMERFWKKGYEATSMRALADTLELHLGSVYNTLGSKEKLFEDALRLHLETNIVPKLQELIAHDNPLEALEYYLERAVEDSVAGKGCFIINSLHEIANINDSVTRLVEDCLDSHRDILSQTVARAQKNGDIPADRDPDKLALFLLSCLMSLRVMSKLKMDDEDIRAVGDCALSSLTSAPGLSTPGTAIARNGNGKKAKKSGKG
jgi:TetR/AcrR family transcriptional repressor of nem operon